MEKFVAILLEKKKIDKEKSIFIPISVVELADEKNFIGINNIRYNLITEDKDDNNIFFIINTETLENIYGNNYINQYLDDIKNYMTIKESDKISFIYSDSEISEVVSIDDFPDFFNAHMNINLQNNKSFDIKKIYNALKHNVFMQDDAIKKIVVALSLHYLDIDEKEKVNIIIDGEKGTGKSTIINNLKEIMPYSVIVEDLGNENFSFDLLFLSLYNNKNISGCPILVLDNADKMLLNSDLNIADKSTNIIKNLMLGNDYMFNTSSGFINYPTNDFVIILMGDFKKRIRCGINNYIEGVPEKISRLTNYNIKMNSISREMVYAKLMNSEIGTFRHYANYINSAGIKVNINDKLINKIIDEVMKSNMHELDKIVEKCFEEILFELYISEEKYSELTIDQKIIKNNKKYLLK